MRMLRIIPVGDRKEGNQFRMHLVYCCLQLPSFRITEETFMINHFILQVIAEDEIIQSSSHYECTN